MINDVSSVKINDVTHRTRIHALMEIKPHLSFLHIHSGSSFVPLFLRRVLSEAFLRYPMCPLSKYECHVRFHDTFVNSFSERKSQRITKCSFFALQYAPHSPPFTYSEAII